MTEDTITRAAGHVLYEIVHFGYMDGQQKHGPWNALKKITGNSKIHLAVADDMEGMNIPASLLSHDGQPGLVRDDGHVDAQINFSTKSDNALPANSRMTWKGTLTIPADGEYWIYLQALGTNAGVKIDGKRAAHTGASQGGVHGDIQHAGQDNIVPTLDGLDNVRRSIQLNAGPHAIEVAVDPDTSSVPVQVRLNWYTPEQRKTDYDAALDAAKKAKVAVVFAWTRLHPTFGLPGDQNKLIEAVASVNPNTIVVLNTSLPVALPWADKWALTACRSRPANRKPLRSTSPRGNSSIGRRKRESG